MNYCTDQNAFKWSISCGVMDINNPDVFFRWVAGKNLELAVTAFKNLPDDTVRKRSDEVDYLLKFSQFGFSSDHYTLNVEVGKGSIDDVELNVPEGATNTNKDKHSCSFDFMGNNYRIYADYEGSSP